MDVKVIPREEVSLQHQLLVCDMIDMLAKIKLKFTPCQKMWKPRDPQACSHFQKVFKALVHTVEIKGATTTEGFWAKLHDNFLKTMAQLSPYDGNMKLGGIRM